MCFGDQYAVSYLVSKCYFLSILIKLGQFITLHIKVIFTTDTRHFIASSLKYEEFFYFFRILFIFRERGRKEKREGGKCRPVASCMPPAGDLAHNPDMPWLRIEPATFWFTGSHSICWATPARAGILFCCSVLLPFYSHTYFELFSRLFHFYVTF